jgi:hypothetical protein
VQTFFKIIFLIISPLTHFLGMPSPVRVVQLFRRISNRLSPNCFYHFGPVVLFMSASSFFFKKKRPIVSDASCILCLNLLFYVQSGKIIRRPHQKFSQGNPSGRALLYVID